MKSIQFNEENYIHYDHTAWNDKVLKVKTNEIYQLNFDTITNGKLLVEEFEKTCIEENINYSIVRINATERKIKDIFSLFGYENIETSFRVINNLKKIKNNENFNRFKIKIEKPNKLSNKVEIKNIVYKDFNFGRFFEDPQIKEEQARLRNSNWVDSLYENSNILGGFYKSQLFGFMAYKINKNSIILELGGVESKFSYLAYPFWYSCLHTFKNIGFDSINTIISANNIGIINLYSYFDFKFNDSYLSLRKFR